MRNIIYNTQTEQLSRIYENGYNVPIPEHEQSFIHVLEIITEEYPIYDNITQRVEEEWKIDLDNNVYRKVYHVIDKSAYEIQCESWDDMDYAVRIVAPISLALLYPEIEVWFRLNGFPVIRRGTDILLYCNGIMEQHLELVSGYNLLVEDRPVEGGMMKSQAQPTSRIKSAIASVIKPTTPYTKLKLKRYMESTLLIIVVSIVVNIILHFIFKLV